MTAQPLLHLENLRVTTATGKQLLAIDEFTVDAGETVALIGNSGAGKSLLAKAAVGLLPPHLRSSSTRHELCGVSVTAATGNLARHNSRSAVGSENLQASAAAPEASIDNIRALHVGYINQDAQGAMDPLRSIYNAIIEQPREQRRRAPKTRKKQPLHAADLQALAHRALSSAGFQNLGAKAMTQLLQRKPGALSGGMRQRALIAAALAARPQLLVADEPTSALDPHIAAAVLRELVAASHGTGLLLISHDLAAVQAHADRVLVIAAGQLVEQGSAAQLLAAPQHPVTRALVAAARGAGQSQQFTSQPLPRSSAAPASADSTAPVVPVPELSAPEQLARAPRPENATNFSFSLQQAGYRRARPVLDELSVEIPAGQCVAFIGPSGSGKSTAAKTLLGLVPHITGMRRSHNPKIGWVPQDTRSSLLPRMSVKQVLREAKPQATPAALTELLAAVELNTALNTKVGQLSGGQVQRLAIARALARDPELLVLDEPVSALDASIRQTIVELLQRINSRRHLSMLLISHELSSVAQLADTVYVFAGGKIVERGSTATIFTHPQSTAAQQMLLEYNSMR